MPPAPRPPTACAVDAASDELTNRSMPRVGDGFSIVTARAGADDASVGAALFASVAAEPRLCTGVACAVSTSFISADAVVARSAF